MFTGGEALSLLFVEPEARHLHEVLGLSSAPPAPFPGLETRFVTAQPLRFAIRSAWGFGPAVAADPVDEDSGNADRFYDTYCFEDREDAVSTLVCEAWLSCLVLRAKLGVDGHSGEVEKSCESFLHDGDGVSPEACPMKLSRRAITMALAAIGVYRPWWNVAEYQPLMDAADLSRVPAEDATLPARNTHRAYRRYLLMSWSPYFEIDAPTYRGALEMSLIDGPAWVSKAMLDGALRASDACKKGKRPEEVGAAATAAERDRVRRGTAGYDYMVALEAFRRLAAWQQLHVCAQL